MVVVVVVVEVEVELCPTPTDVAVEPRRPPEDDQIEDDLRQ